jgi:hypothetical protein
MLHYRRIDVHQSTVELLQDQRGGQDLGDRAEEESGVFEHRCAGGDVRGAVGYDDLLAGVVDAGDESGEVVGLAVGDGLLADLGFDGVQCVVVHANHRRTLTLGQGQAEIKVSSVGRLYAFESRLGYQP